MYQRFIGLSGFDAPDTSDAAGNDHEDSNSGTDKPSNTAFALLPSPVFQPDLDDFLRGLRFHYPSSTTFGGIASTVSSLSRAKLFRYDESDPTAATTYSDGCVGAAMTGDIAVQTLVAQGTKPAGGVYRVVTGNDSTIKAIVLDEEATQEANEAATDDEDQLMDDDDDDDDEDDAEESNDVNARMAAAYAKASIPKPVLAEANFLMKNLSDDDQSFMRKALLIGLEGGGSVGRTPNELARLAQGQGHRFTVYQVASAGMKDGSVTLPLGRVNVTPGTRMRFFVRESAFGKKEVEALVTGYKKRELERLLASGPEKQNDDDDDDAKPATSTSSFTPAVCMLVPTLDRGSKFFGGKAGFESSTVVNLLPSLPCLSGFFSNGAIGRLDSNEPSSELDAVVHGSATGYFLIGSGTLIETSNHRWMCFRFHRNCFIQKHVMVCLRSLCPSHLETIHFLSLLSLYDTHTLSIYLCVCVFHLHTYIYIYIYPHTNIQHQIVRYMMPSRRLPTKPPQKQGPQRTKPPNAHSTQRTPNERP